MFHDKLRTLASAKTLCSEVNYHYLRNDILTKWIFLQTNDYLMVCIAAISARPADCLRRMIRCTASLLGMTRAMNILAVTQVYCTGWKPCLDWDGSLKGHFIKMNWNQSGQHLKRLVSCCKQ